MTTGRINQGTVCVVYVRWYENHTYIQNNSYVFFRKEKNIIFVYKLLYVFDANIYYKKYNKICHVYNFLNIYFFICEIYYSIEICW